MGVKNLWDILESCKKTLPLHHLQNKRVCIDLSCWIVQLQTASKNHSSVKDKVYLQTLFHRLRALLSLNCSLIFVSDGSIPAIKLATYRRRLGSNCEVARDETSSHKVSSLTRNMGSDFSCMIKEAKVLAMALGIPCLDGVEEAEAQCALLNSESLCDACFSSDSDIFLFGAKTVYRDMYLGEGGHVVCYDMVDIEQKLGYGRNSLITLALLLGSDYSQGVHGLGPEKAGQIVKSIGDDVILQQIASEGLAFVKKMKGSKKHGKVLKCNANKENSLVHEQKDIVNGQHPLQDDQFLQVINAYLKPKCHSPDSEAVHRVLGPHPFQRSKLQQVCAESFGWTPEKTDEYILPKIGERDLRRFANLRSASSGLGVLLPMDKMPVNCPITSIIKQRKVKGKDCFEVAWDHLDGLTSSIVPADLLESACPEMIVEFNERGAEGKKRSHRTRAKKSDNKAALIEVDLKLQALMLDIETESHAASAAAICSKHSTIPSYAETESHAASAAAICSKHPTIPSYAATEIIDLLSPSPPIRARKVSNYGQTTSTQIEVINICDSETDISPLEHERKSRAEILSSQVVTKIFLDD